MMTEINLALMIYFEVWFEQLYLFKKKSKYYNI